MTENLTVTFIHNWFHIQQQHPLLLLNKLDRIEKEGVLFSLNSSNALPKERIPNWVLPFYQNL